MGSDVLALDTIQSATFFFAGKWSPKLKGNQARDVLRFLVCRLYDQGRGRVGSAQIILAQTTLARKLGLSRQWIGVLLDRLQQAGWLECYAPRLDTGMHGSTVFRPGRQLKRLLITLAKGRARKSPKKCAANDRWRFSPSKEEKRLFFIRQREQEVPSPEMLARMPLLKRWLGRGGDTCSSTPPTLLHSC
jgi:hypothetical protein